MIAKILGHSGSFNRGVYRITIGRQDVELTEHGTPVGVFMGFNTWAAWQGTSEKAAVAGDFTMLEDETAPVIKTPAENDIEVVALHNHMVLEEPIIFFLHYWGLGCRTSRKAGQRDKECFTKQLMLTESTNSSSDLEKLPQVHRRSESG